MNNVDVVLFGDCVNDCVDHKIAVERHHGKFFEFAMNEVLAIIIALRNLCDIQNFVCDTSMTVDFVKKEEFELILRAIKQCNLSGEVGCAASRIHHVKKIDATRLANLLSEDHNCGKILQAAINKKANYGRIATTILSCRLIDTAGNAELAPSVVSINHAPFNITAFKSTHFDKKTCIARCGAISKCVKHLMGEVWKVGGRFMLYGLSAGTEPIRLLNVFKSSFSSEEVTSQAHDWSQEVCLALSRDPFFAEFVVPREEALRTDDSEVFYYVMCVFGAELINHAIKETESIFRMMSVEVERQKTLFINPYLNLIRAQYDEFLMNVFGDTSGNITSDDWELKCLDATIDSSTMSKITRLWQLLLQLHYLDLFAKDEIDGAGPYALITSLSAPTTYFATKEAALDAGFAVELSPPSFFVILVGAPVELYPISAKDAPCDDVLILNCPST
jgi:hypothetical protein